MGIRSQTQMQEIKGNASKIQLLLSHALTRNFSYQGGILHADESSFPGEGTPTSARHTRSRHEGVLTERVSGPSRTHALKNPIHQNARIRRGIEEGPVSE